MGIKKWSDFLNDRESAGIDESVKTGAADAIGEPLDNTYRQEDEYKKMLEFLRGKKNIANGALGDKPLIPQSASKGWFVVDEESHVVATPALPINPECPAETIRWELRCRYRLPWQVRRCARQRRGTGCPANCRVRNR